MKHSEKIWFNGKMIEWNDAKVHVMANSLQYGTGVFEGIRCYETKKRRAIFRLEEHVDRLFFSAESIYMDLPWTKKEITEAIIETVRVNSDMKSSYIRPFFYYGFSKIGLNPKDSPIEGAIGLFDMSKYLGEESARVKVSNYMRIHPKTSVLEAKISGYYVNSILANVKAIKEGYTEALMLDYEGYVAEGSAENFFIVKDSVIITPPLGTILNGITRKSIIELADYLNYEFKEEKITLDDALNADECFFTGTATELAPIASINDQKIRYENGPVTQKLKENFMRVIKGENKDFEKWLTWVN